MASPRYGIPTTAQRGTAHDALERMRGRRFIAFGNPGVGKSTLLNAFFGGTAAFTSGVSFGGGLTRGMQWRTTKQGIALCDTPGLADAAMYKECAAEISKALRQEEPFSFFFVVRLEAGRVVNEDATTMKAVLEALGQEVAYGVVFNKVSEKMLATMKETDKRKVELVLCNQLPCKPQGFCYLPALENLDCASVEAGGSYASLLAEAPLDLLVFMKTLRENRVNTSKVKAVESDNAKFQKEAAKMQEEADAQRREVAECLVRMMLMMAEHEKDTAAKAAEHEAELDALRRKAEEDRKEAERQEWLEYQRKKQASAEQQRRIKELEGQKLELNRCVASHGRRSSGSGCCIS
eukprot:TRINITY_DN4014_c0_g2_i2.p1 TRINITY_DN4014_c0_g2~~TRINITY_DN4014_c0_g2_i2.p1  ORF type:complete len:372 (+),score=117.24 TRINITY_DN4014_c0_g2_i2:67-1116(+)